MTVDDETLRKLSEELDASAVKVLRHNGARYLEGWYVVSAANGIFGYDGWSYEVLEVAPVSSWNVERRRNGQPYQVRVTLYQAKVRVEALGRTRVDVGTNIAEDETAEAHETAIKGAATDGLKRALRTFGNQFGNALYDHDAGFAAQPTASLGDSTRRTAESHPQAPRTATPPAQRPEPQHSASDGERQFANVGELLTAALRELNLDRTQVQKIVGVASPTEVADLAGAWKTLVQHQTELEQAAAAL